MSDLSERRGVLQNRLMVVFDAGEVPQAVDADEVASVRGSLDDRVSTLILRSGVSVLVRASFETAIKAIGWDWRLFFSDGTKCDNLSTLTLKKDA